VRSPLGSLLRAALWGVTLLTAGCYSIGYEAAPEVGRVLAVPIFRNQTLRRHLEHDLTRHVRRELLESTSLHLAPEGPDVAVLRGSVVAVDEGVLIAGAAEEVRFGELRVHVTFGVYRGARLVVGEDSDGDGRPDREFALTGLAERDTTRGETRGTASDEALRDVAERIALLLQGRRDDRHEPNQDVAQAAALLPGPHARLIQRDEDWYRLEVPARRALRVTLFHAGDVAQDLRDAKGRPRRARTRDEGRILEIVGGEAPEPAYLRVAGKDEGAPYQVDVDVLSDDPYEPNQAPDTATALSVGGPELRLLARDEDWLVVDVPAGQPLELRITAQGKELRTRLCDAEGVPLPKQEGTHGLRRLSSSSIARKVYVRIDAADSLPYRIQAR
jgi:hypothetical protein